jgi:collagen type I/II/III/V/XI/XXIV/XXVII alpha
MTTISTGTTLGLILTPASYSNPIVIERGVTIANSDGAGVVGSYGASGYFIIQNNGTIAGSAGGLALYGGGSVTNLSGGEIVATTAIHSAVYVGGGAGTVVNAGAIIGDGASGVDLKDGGGITNQAGGTIGSGGTHTAVYGTAAPVAVVNAGLIYGIDLLAGGTVINQPTGIIERAGLGVYLAGAAGTVINAGTIAGTGGGISNAVLLPAGYADRAVVDPGAAFTGIVSGGNSVSGTIVSTLELASASSAGTLAGLGTQFIDFGTIAFDAGGQWSIAGNTSGLAGTISGFAPGDTIGLTGVIATGSHYAGGVLTLDEADGFASLRFSGTLPTTQFVVTPITDGTDVLLACFRAGTRVQTARGEVAVEALRVGDRMPAHEAGGRMALRPVVWTGHRALDCRGHPRPHDTWPVRIAAGAFGDGLPRHDLWLSPDHSVYCDDRLIPVRHLVNGATIVQERVDAVTYWHVELPRHAVILAEGLPCESYLDTGNRAVFGSGMGRRRTAAFADRTQ